MSHPDKIFSLAADPDDAINTYEDFIKSYQHAFGETFAADENFLKLFGNSRFLPRMLISNPEIANAKVAPTTLHTLKYKAYLKITLDILNNRPTRPILNELSQLAREIINKVHEQAKEELNRELGIEKSESNPHTYFAMGKLGANELNYSSDVDMIGAYTTNNIDVGGISAREYFSKLSQKMGSVLQTPGPQGFLYRVDWDLRPEGKAGVLVNSFDGLMNYYENFGADWERQALIRLSPLAGSRDLAENIKRRLEPFVYRKSFDLDSLNHVRAMYEKIAADLKSRPQTNFNVKLGLGGIRQLEFFIQSFQLLYGGKFPSLKIQNTLDTLDALLALKLLTPIDAKALSDAYLFLRKLENCLQLVNEAQTQILPDDRQEQIKTAKRMGYASGDILHNFLKDLEYHTQNVRRLFDEWLFDKPVQGTDTIDQKATQLQSQVAAEEHFESKLNRIRLYKKEEIKKIVATENSSSRTEILKNISETAITIVRAALELARGELIGSYGTPLTKKFLEITEEAHLIILGMGKLGGREINYESDLDLIFIFNENGETTGPKIITNGEYFAKLTQKLISILSSPTSMGVAYPIDIQLRPSGNAGPLVTTLESFIEYHRQTSQIWELQALTRATPIAGPAHLSHVVLSNIHTLLYSQAHPEGIKHEINRLRDRMIKELARENADTFDFKLGPGGLVDIEFMIQYLQLRWGYLYLGIRSPSTIGALKEMISLQLLPEKMEEFKIEDLYLFLRTLESKLSLKNHRSGHRVSRSEPVLLDAAKEMGYESTELLLQKFDEVRKAVRKLYEKIIL